MKLQFSTDHVWSEEYVNTGGGCMVSIFEVWLPADNRVAWLFVNEEGGTLATCDYIQQDIDYNDDMLLDNWHIDSLSEEHRYFELYRYCFVRYIKSDYRRYGQRYAIPLHMLTPELQQQMTAEYIEWHLTEISPVFETDGETIFMDDTYIPSSPKLAGYFPLKTLTRTLKDARIRCIDSLTVNEEVMDDDDIRELRTTIDDLQYYIGTL